MFLSLVETYYNSPGAGFHRDCIYLYPVPNELHRLQLIVK